MRTSIHREVIKLAYDHTVTESGLEPYLETVLVDPENNNNKNLLGYSV